MLKKKILAFFTLTSLISSIVFGCGSVLFMPVKEAAAAGTDGYEDVYFKTPDSISLHGRFIRTSLPKKGTVIFFHGYTEKINDRISSVLWLKDAGYDIFAFDYRGSGRSGGAPSLKGIYIDTEAAIETVFNITGVKGDPVFILGQSLGGAAAVYAVANSPYKEGISGLIIDSSFASYPALPIERLKTPGVSMPVMDTPTGLVDGSYDPARWIHDVSPVPVIIVHGESDTVVPLGNGLELYDRAARPKVLMIAEGKGHEQALTDMDIRRSLASYLARVN